MYMELAKASKCAQCKKEYQRTTVRTTGCPKCAPGLKVDELKFREPIKNELQRKR